MNDEFFCPRGLYCLVLTWNPESSATHSDFDLTSTISSTLKPTRVIGKFKTSDGNSYGDFDFPEAAPLIFPGLDNLAVQTGEEAEKTRTKLKAAKNFASDYLDRRSRAKYVS